ncbi:MAG: DNA primase [Clostridia bacterium]|nr:DNA primase [Clostridia bacterium]
MKYPRTFIDELLNRADIYETVVPYVTLKRAGSNYSGLCPFHSEKSPSFTVFPGTNSFYCFGCGVGGDPITFIRLSENLEYPEAVAFLAERVGLSLPSGTEYGDDGQGGMRRDRLFGMNLDAARYFRDCLFRPEGASGLAYLKENRQLADSTIRHFGLGFCPDDGVSFLRYMRDKKYSDEELIAGFLAKRSPKTGHLYPLFRNRVIYPIIDTSGHVIAFGGRVMNDSKPKYLNSSDTVVFSKKKNLYALNYAKSVCSEEIILCEGYMDVIAMHAAGFTNAVATLGTAITPSHARVLSKYTKRCILIYDSDEAGQKADAKAMQILSEVGLDVRVLKLQGAKDPDEFIRKFGKDAFARAVRASQTGFEYKYGVLLSRYNMDDLNERAKAVEAACGLAAEFNSPVEREIYGKRIAKDLEMSDEVVLKMIARSYAGRKKQAKAENEKQAQRELYHYGDRVNSESASNVRAAAAEDVILGMILLYEDHLKYALSEASGLVEQDFVTSFSRRVFSLVREQVRQSGSFSFSLLGEELKPEEMGRLQQLMEIRRGLSQNGRDVLDDSIRVLKEEARSRDVRSSGSFAEKMELLRKRKGASGEAEEQKNG